MLVKENPGAVATGKCSNQRGREQSDMHLPPSPAPPRKPLSRTPTPHRARLLLAGPGAQVRPVCQP